MEGLSREVRALPKEATLNAKTGRLRYIEHLQREQPLRRPGSRMRPGRGMGGMMNCLKPDRSGGERGGESGPR